MPPSNVAAVALITRTIAVSSGVFSPFIVSLTPPLPYFILLGVASLAFLASAALPAPGNHLSKLEETKDKAMKIVEGETEEPTLLQDFEQPHFVQPTPLVHH